MLGLARLAATSGKLLMHFGLEAATSLGARKPAITVIICGLFDEKWLLEIEVVAAA